jgi:hypothetical protein
MRLPAALGPGPHRTIGDDEFTNRRRITLNAAEPEFPPAADYQEFTYFVCGRRSAALTARAF